MSSAPKVVLLLFIVFCAPSCLHRDAHPLFYPWYHLIPRATVKTHGRTLLSTSRSSSTSTPLVAPIVVIIVGIISIATYPRADKLAHTTRKIICHLWAIDVNEVAPSSWPMGALAQNI